MKTIGIKEYDVLNARMEKLLKLVSNETSANDPNLIELDVISALIEEYEEIHYPISRPTLQEVLKMRMEELNITQKGLSDLLEVSPSRISEIITGKVEPTLSIARKIGQKLNISASVILGI